MKGFTLLETVVVIAVTTLMLALLVGLYLSMTATFSQSSGAVQVSAEVAAVMREAEVMTLPASHVLASHVFSTATYTSSASALVLELPAIDSSGNQIAGKYDYAAFYRTGTVADRLLEIDPASSRIPGVKHLGTSVSALSFTYNDTDFTKIKKVDVTVTAQKIVKGATFSSSLHEQVYLRNK